MTDSIKPQFLNPSVLAKPNGFSHVSIGDPKRLVYVSGQVSYDSSGAIVGEGDLAAQTRQVFLNLKVALEAAGSDFYHVLKLTFFVRNLTPERMAIIRQVRREFLHPDHPPASTMIGAAALAKDALELEVEAYAQSIS
jgi:enamine deaminase RidA (YjgF/YER057c/UK114 family)